MITMTTDVQNTKQGGTKMLDNIVNPLVNSNRVDREVGEIAKKKLIIRK